MGYRGVHGGTSAAAVSTVLAPVPFGRDPRAVSVRRVAMIMIEHLDGLAVRSASEIWTRETELRDSLSGPDRLYGPCRITMGAALDSLVSEHMDHDRLVEVHALGKAASEQGLPLEVVLRGLRVDFLVLWSEMLLVARTIDPTTQQNVMNASEIVWGAVDAVTLQFTIGYRSNHEARLRAEAARRVEVLQRIFEGSAVTVTDLEDVLKVDPAEGLVVVAVDARCEVAIDDLARAIRYSAMHSVWVSRGYVIGGLVSLRSANPDALRRVLSGIPGLRAGVARPLRSVAEVPRALAEATLALNAMPPLREGPVTIFDDPAAVLVVADPKLASCVLREVLSPILEGPERDRAMLFETIVAFDECDGVVSLVADRLFCHRNTVLNRMAKIGRLTGISFTAPSGLVLVALAARAARAGLLDPLDPLA